jgi:hypothetical protein|tara:strand:- start:10 stop:165 length:156 start_codon:yes stop_codon:yes gene_type:complete
MGKEHMFAQDTPVGKLGLAALSQTGFSGPPCNLSDLDVWVRADRGNIDVSF